MSDGDDGFGGVARRRGAEQRQVVRSRHRICLAYSETRSMKRRERLRKGYVPGQRFVFLSGSCRRFCEGERARNVIDEVDLWPRGPSARIKRGRRRVRTFT